MDLVPKSGALCIESEFEQSAGFFWRLYVPLHLEVLTGDAVSCEEVGEEQQRS